MDVCPSLCLQIVSVSRLGDDADVARTVDCQLDGLDVEEASAIIKDETVCIRCGLCAERCPTGAITMERFLFKEVPTCQVD